MSCGDLQVAEEQVAGGVTAAQEALPSLKSQIQSQSWIHLLLGVWIPFLYLINFVASSFTKKIRWRGIRYELISPQQTRIIR